MHARCPVLGKAAVALWAPSGFQLVLAVVQLVCPGLEVCTADPSPGRGACGLGHLLPPPKQPGDLFVLCCLLREWRGAGGRCPHPCKATDSRARTQIHTKLPAVAPRLTSMQSQVRWVPIPPWGGPGEEEGCSVCSPRLRLKQAEISLIPEESDARNWCPVCFSLYHVEAWTQEEDECQARWVWAWTSPLRMK